MGEFLWASDVCLILIERLALIYAFTFWGYSCRIFVSTRAASP